MEPGAIVLIAIFGLLIVASVNSSMKAKKEKKENEHKG